MHMKVVAWTRKSRRTHTLTNAQTPNSHCGDYETIVLNLAQHVRLAIITNMILCGAGSTTEFVYSITIAFTHC